MTKINTAAGDLVIPVAAADLTEADLIEANLIEAGVGELEVVETADPGRRTRLARLGERGMVSAEWTVGIIAAVAIAGVLLAVVTSGPVESALLKVVLSIIKTFTKNI